MMMPPCNIQLMMTEAISLVHRTGDHHLFSQVYCLMGFGIGDSFYSCAEYIS